MIITELQQLYATHPNVEGMCKLLKDNSVRHLYCSGLCASAASLFSSVLVQRAECPFVFILGDLEEAGYFYHDLTQILGTGQVLFFPSSFRRAIKYGQKDAANEILRTEVLSRLQKGEEGFCVVTYPDALAEKVVSRKELGDKTLKLHAGEKVDMDFVTAGPFVPFIRICSVPPLSEVTLAFTFRGVLFPKFTRLYCTHAPFLLNKVFQPSNLFAWFR